MAQGIELILGFERKDRDVLTKALGLTLDEEGELHGAVVAVRRACDRAHSAAIVAMGWTEQGKSKNRYKRVETGFA